MKLVSKINGEPSISWFVALATLVLVGAAVLFIPISLLMFVFFPLAPSYRFPVCMAIGTIGVPLILFVWRCVVLEILRRATFNTDSLNSNPN